VLTPCDTPKRLPRQDPASQLSPSSLPPFSAHPFALPVITPCASPPPSLTKDTSLLSSAGLAESCCDGIPVAVKCASFSLFVLVVMSYLGTFAPKTLRASQQDSRRQGRSSFAEVALATPISPDIIPVGLQKIDVPSVLTIYVYSSLCPALRIQ